MPFGVFSEALPSISTHGIDHELNANVLLSGRSAASWHLTASTRPRIHSVSTSFSEAQITTCQEGFRCVSRVGRFGTDHVKEVLRDKARVAQSQNKADMEGGEAAEGGDQAAKKGDPTVEEYEWNCPVQQNWVQDRFESGVEADQCREEKDCICIARGAEDSYVELKDGLEKRHETVEAEIGCGGGKTQKIQLVVIPHYPIRSVPESFDPDNINSDMGEIMEWPSEMWVNTYKNNASKLQAALDKLKHFISETYSQKVADKPFVCGSPLPGQNPTMTPDEVHEASVKIRRFQILQQDCANMRDTVPMLISPTSEKVSPPGQQFLSLKQKLNCYKGKGGDTCLQLNCYTGHDDTIFRDHLREFEAKMMNCEPEPEDQGTAAGIASPTTATKGAALAGPGVVAGGATPMPAASKQSVGAQAAALSLLLSSNRDPESKKNNASLIATSKRSNWRSFL